MGAVSGALCHRKGQCPLHEHPLGLEAELSEATVYGAGEAIAGPGDHDCLIRRVPLGRTCPSGVWEVRRKLALVVFFGIVFGRGLGRRGGGR